MCGGREGLAFLESKGTTQKKLVAGGSSPLLLQYPDQYICMTWSRDAYYLAILTLC